jgi:hypothetical protein
MVKVRKPVVCQIPPKDFIEVFIGGEDEGEGGCAL